MKVCRCVHAGGASTITDLYLTTLGKRGLIGPAKLFNLATGGS